MKYIRQLLIILGVTLVAELLKLIIPLSIPASIYGIFLMFALLCLKIIKVEQVSEVAFLMINAMPLMFIMPAVNLLNYQKELAGIFWKLLIIVATSTFFILIVTGKVADYLLKKAGENVDDNQNHNTDPEVVYELN